MMLRGVAMEVREVSRILMREGASSLDAEYAKTSVHFSIAGQIAEQIAAVLEGGAIGGFNLIPPSRQPWWRF